MSRPAGRPVGAPEDRRRPRKRSPRAHRRGNVRLALLAAVLAAVALAAVLTSGRPDPVGRRRPEFAVGQHGDAVRVGQRQHAQADGRSLPRTLTTYLRYPAVRAGTGARPVRGRAFPLVVFGHGFGYTPQTYRRLLDAWTRAGYVVAAPVFPLENAAAPGGPYRMDLPNQPGDVTRVIDRVLTVSAARSGRLRGLVDPRRIAVAGHSDGGATALATAYNRQDRDRRVRAVMVMSGAQLPGIGGWDYRPGQAPLLAVQGTGDTVNLPADTRAFWARAAAPKYLLSLTGAGHLAPYVEPGPRFTIVRSVTLDFLDRYLRADADAGARLAARAGRAGRYTFTRRPTGPS